MVVSILTVRCVLQVTRMEGQVTRYKCASENAEKVEDELKAEKRRLQREVCPLNVSHSTPMFSSTEDLIKT